MGGNLSTLGFAVAILVLSLFASGKQYDRGDARRKTFLISVCICIVGNICAFFSYVLDGKAPDLIIMILNLVPILTVDLITAAFAYYIRALINEEMAFPYAYANVVSITCAIDMVIVTIMSLTGQVFTVQNGYYIPGPHESMQGLVCLFCLVYLFVIVVVKRDCLGDQSLYAVVLIMVIPNLSTVFERMSTVRVEYTLPSIALAQLGLFLLVQNGVLEESKVREQLLAEMAMFDALTGLQNRRAYDLQKNNMDPDMNVGVIFCDLNGLKATNDMYGHEAGDKLILEFVDVLRQNFRANDMYRIGGDEFVLLVKTIEEPLFAAKVDRMYNELSSRNNLAAMGFCYGKGANLQEMINKAEQDMYEDKRVFYA